MKVYIGPYENFYTTRYLEDWWFQRTRKKDSWEVKEKDYTMIDKIVVGSFEVYFHLVLRPLNKYNAWKGRKIKVRIDYYDTWGMDTTLAHIILPMLKQLKAEKQGSCVVDVEDVPEHLRPTEPPSPENNYTDSTVHERWDWVMDEMIWAFEQVVNDYEDSQFHSGNIDVKFVEQENGLSRLEKGPNDTHVYDAEGHKKHNERIRRGLMFFGKYYQGLWD